MKKDYNQQDLDDAKKILRVNVDEIQLAVFLHKLKENAACKAYKDCLKEKFKFKEIKTSRVEKMFSRWLQWKSDKININKNKQ